jgi:hypothetical protein
MRADDGDEFAGGDDFGGWPRLNPQTAGWFDKSEGAPRVEGRSGLHKRLHVNSCLAKDRSECALSEIPGVMRDGDLSSCLRMAPDLMAAGALAVELKAESAKAAYNFAVRKSR